MSVSVRIGRLQELPNWFAMKSQQYQMRTRGSESSPMVVVSANVLLNMRQVWPSKPTIENY